MIARRFNATNSVRSGVLAVASLLWTLDCSANAMQISPVHGPVHVQTVPLLLVSDTMPVITLKDVTTPAAGSADRKAIMDVLRKTVPDEFQPVKFKVNMLKVGGGYATAMVLPLKANGQAIGCAEGDDIESEFWLKKVKGQWTIIVSNICGGDPAYFEAKDKGAPPQLLGKNSWEEIIAE